jgi:5-methylcytosine-specific restriction endonuclease McrA
VSPLAYLCPSCGTLVSKQGRCPDCKRGADRFRGTTTARGYGRDWQKLATQAKRHQPYCSITGCNSTDLTVDHLDPGTKGKHGLTLNDVQVLCRSHNSSKGKGCMRFPEGASRDPLSSQARISVISAETREPRIG